MHDLFILIGTFKSDVAYKVIKDEVNVQPHIIKGITVVLYMSHKRAYYWQCHCDLNFLVCNCFQLYSFSANQEYF